MRVIRTYFTVALLLFSVVYSYGQCPEENPDITPPYLKAPPDVVTINDIGLCSAVVTSDILSYPDYYDRCGVITLISSGIPSGSAFPVGTTIVTWTANDSAGNSTSRTQKVIVTDSEAPTISCPSDLIVNSDPGQCNAYVTVPLVTFSDNCPDSSVTNTYNSGGANASGTYPIGTTTVFFTIADTANKTATCSMKVTVTNNQNPSLTLVGSNSITLEACSPYEEYGATAFDSCLGDISSSIVIDSSSLDTTKLGTYSITYNLSNTSGNSATQLIRTVNIVDTKPPTLTLNGPDPLTIGHCSTYTELGAFLIDPCFGDISENNVFADYSGVDFATPGTYTVTYTGKDDSGYEATPITRTIILTDVTEPEITLLGENPQIIEACDTYTELGATAFDPCLNTVLTDSIIIDASGVNTAIPGTYFVTYNVADTNGNDAIEVIRSVEVINTTPLTLICPANIIVDNDLGECSTTVTFDPPIVSANCPTTITQIDGLPSGSIFPIGTTTNTFEVFDDFGQSETCSFDVTVNDTENPTAICQNISIQLDPTTGIATITPTDIDNGSYDNCTFITTLSQSTFDCSNIGDNTVTLIVTDDTGNISTCDAVVTVTDLAQNSTVSISESVNPICQNASVTFTATAVDGGTNPTFQWQINGIDIAGETASTFTTSILNDGDSVKVVMQSNTSFCAASILSDPIIINVNDTNPPANAGPDITNNICTNTTINLTANEALGAGSSGLWTVTSGQTSGFSFSDDTSPISSFTGDVGETYILTWSIDNPEPCIDTNDSLTVTFIGCSALDFDGTNDNITFRDFYNFNSDFTIEVWMKSEVTNGDIQTILSKREADNLVDGYDLRLVNNYISFHWNDGESLTSPFPIINNQWHHIAVVFENNTYTLYIDGIEVNSASGSAPIVNSVDCILGAMDQTISAPFKPLNYFNGGMDELRIWNVSLSMSQIRKMMNQEIEDNAGSIMGSTVPIAISGLSWTDLNGYYKMNQSTDLIGGNLNASNNNSINGLLRYMTTLQPESAPIPYQSNADGLWSDNSTWLNGSVQAIPNSKGIDDGITAIDWNIVRTSNNIESGNTNITLLGLNVNSNTLAIVNTNPLDGQSLTITDYLIINGTLDLVGESQLLQTENSIVDYTGIGNLQRDQQGTSNLFNYNYWSSPVSANGIDYTVESLLYDGSNYTSPQTINWTTNNDATGSNNPITLSRRWIYTFEDTPGTDYSDWVYKGQNSPITVGLGFTLKGSGVGDPFTDEQNYVFVGHPNNGDITVPIVTPYQAFVGNPYPSALDANQFINENGPTGTDAIDGTLYFWEHSKTNNSHVLSEYEGGYATYSLSGGVAAITAPTEINGLGTVGKIPKRYIPIAQGFYVTSSASGGSILFNNGQRKFEKESGGNSLFLRSDGAKTKDNALSNTSKIKRVRLKIKAPDGSIRPLLLAFTPNNEASEGIDYGYDAENTEIFPNDVSFMIEGKKFVIEGTGEFDNKKRYPLGLFLSNSGQVEFALSDLENFETDIDVYIYDDLSGISSKINDSNFKMTLGTGDYLDRFYVTFVPTELLSTPEIDDFSATVNYLIDTNEIYIRIPISVELKQVHLYNILGQKVTSWNITNVPNLSNEMRIPIKDISEGAYIVKVETNSSRIINKKIIIKYH